MSDLVPDLVVDSSETRSARVVDVDSANGVIFALDCRGRSVSRFDSNGRALGVISIGNQAEVELIPAITQVLAAEDGTVYVPDAEKKMVLVFDGASQTLLNEIVLSVTAPFPNRWAMGRPGQLFVSTLSIPLLDIVRRALRNDEGNQHDKDLVVDEVMLRISILQDGELSPVVSIARPGLLARSVNDEVSLNPVAERTLWAASADGTIFVAEGRRRVIRQYSSVGDLLAEHTISVEPEVMSAQLQQAIRSTWLRSLLPHDFQDGATPPSLPGVDVKTSAVLPPFMDMVLDEYGRAWLRKASSAQEFVQRTGKSSLDVFLRGSREWYILRGSERLGAVRFPEGFQLTRVRGGYSYGYRNREEGVQTIERYPVPAEIFET